MIVLAGPIHHARGGPMRVSNQGKIGRLKVDRVQNPIAPLFLSPGGLDWASVRRAVESITPDQWQGDQSEHLCGGNVDRLG